MRWQLQLAVTLQLPTDRACIAPCVRSHAACVDLLAVPGSRLPQVAAQHNLGQLFGLLRVKV